MALHIIDACWVEYEYWGWRLSTLVYLSPSRHKYLLYVYEIKYTRVYIFKFHFLYHFYCAHIKPANQTLR